MASFFEEIGAASSRREYTNSVAWRIAYYDHAGKQIAYEIDAIGCTNGHFKEIYNMKGELLARTRPDSSHRSTIIESVRTRSVTNVSRTTHDMQGMTHQVSTPCNWNAGTLRRDFQPSQTQTLIRDAGGKTVGAPERYATLTAAAPHVPRRPASVQPVAHHNVWPEVPPAPARPVHRISLTRISKDVEPPAPLWRRLYRRAIDFIFD